MEVRIFGVILGKKKEATIAFRVWGFVLEGSK